jgi:tryptophan synthase alpha chain
MGYYNPIFHYGPERFAVDAAAAGVDGILLVDLPPEEAGTFKKAASREGLDVIFLLAPTSDDERVAKVAESGSGFVYYVSVTGVTGARKSVATSVSDQVKKIKARVNLPVVVGFGISNPEQAGQAAAAADGVVVGSALVKLFEEASGEELHRRLATLVAALRDGVDKGIR